MGLLVPSDRNRGSLLRRGDDSIIIWTSLSFVDQQYFGQRFKYQMSKGLEEMGCFRKANIFLNFAGLFSAICILSEPDVYGHGSKITDTRNFDASLLIRK